MGEESSAEQSQQLVALKLEDGVGEESSAEQSQQLVALKLVSPPFSVCNNSFKEWGRPGNRGYKCLCVCC